MIDREMLRKARKRAGMTQAELAVLLDVHQKTIQNWETTGVPWKSESEVRRVLGRAMGDVLESDRLSREAQLADALVTINRRFSRLLPDRELRAYTDFALLRELERRARLRDAAREPDYLRGPVSDMTDEEIAERYETAADTSEDTSDPDLRTP